MRGGVRCEAILVIAAVSGMVGMRPSVAQPDRQRWTGETSVTWDAETDTTVVSVDTDDDARIDVAFRLQRTGPVPDDLGRAAVLFARTTLVVLPDGGEATAFVVAGREADLDASLGQRVVPVAGLAVFPDPPARSATEVAQRLAATPCGISPLAGPCADCEFGGPGSDSCGPPPGGTCTVYCMEEMYACCTAPDECRCCEGIEGGRTADRIAGYRQQESSAEGTVTFRSSPVARRIRCP